MLEAVKDQVDATGNPAPPALTHIQHNQEQAGWRRWKKAVEYVGFLGGDKSQTSEAQCQEVAEVIEHAVKLRTRLNSDHGSGDLLKGKGREGETPKGVTRPEISMPQRSSWKQPIHPQYRKDVEREEEKDSDSEEDCFVVGSTSVLRPTR